MAGDVAAGFAARLAGARVLVTGGSSFIGTNLVAAYKRAGIPVTNADVASPRNPKDRDAWFRTDVTRLDELRRTFSVARPTHVFHLAARTDLDGRRVDDYDANVTGVANLMKVVQDTQSVTRTVVASSRMVCGVGYHPRSDDDYCPTTAYGASKVETERLVRAATALPWVLVRPTSIWGPWFGRPYRDFFLSIARGHYMHPAGRRIHKSFGFVGNTVWQLHSVMTAPAADVLGRTFYLADDPPIEVGDFARCISTAMGRRPSKTMPLPILRTIARAGDAVERAGFRAPLTSFRLDNLLTPMVHDLGAMMRLSGPLPYDEQAGVIATVAWMRQQGLLDLPGDR
ncbi:MAG: NAD-dependent epimerase/dehydratase family protein [Solirubrobacteraceae bacterium]